MESLSKLLIQLKGSMVGVVAVGGQVTGVDAENTYATSTKQNPTGIGQSAAPDGTLVILAYADPKAFAERYGEAFNAMMSGNDLFRTVVSDPGCNAIQINSALSETSIIIYRKTILAMFGAEFVAPKPWWKFW
mgnify:CR=1 FL=1